MLEATNFPQQKPDGITAAGIIRSRFDMFVRLLPGQAGRYPGKSLTWCHRGDKFTDDPEKMLCNLLRMYIKNPGKYSLVELYDNTRPKNDQERIVLRVFNGVVEINRLQAYAAMLTKFVIPEYLKA